MTVAPLHQRIARVWTRATRVRRASVAAVVVSVAGWAVDTAAGPYALAIAAAALVAAAWPVRGRERAALAWIGDHVGLAYETALELPEGDDAFGLRRAVAVQGRLVIRDLKPPKTPAWWVPALLLAVTLWVWGAWVGAPWSPPWAAPTSPTRGTPAPPDGDGPVAPPVEVTVPERATPETAPPTAAAGDGDAGGDGGAAGAGGDGGAPSERNALERFAQNLREREAAAPAGSVGAADDGAEGADGDGEADARSEVAAPRSPDPGGDGEASGEGEANDQAGAEGGDEGREGPSDQEGDQAGGHDGGPEEGDASPQSEGAQNDQAPLGGDAEGAGLDAGDEGGDAGIGAGVEGEIGPEVGADARAPEALPSMLGPGPESEVGAVTLPGASEGVFPGGDAATGYRRAVEVALTEGEVPVPYQEVIRNYFR